MLVAVIGPTLSAYLYTWQSNQDVEEDISMGRRRLSDRLGTTKEDLHHWAQHAYWYMLSEFTVPWVAAESPKTNSVPRVSFGSDTLPRQPNPS